MSPLDPSAGEVILLLAFVGAVAAFVWAWSILSTLGEALKEAERERGERP